MNKSCIMPNSKWDQVDCRSPEWTPRFHQTCQEVKETLRLLEGAPDKKDSGIEARARLRVSLEA
jgi:hypothetical protein